jgi:hypothetical protein
MSEWVWDPYIVCCCAEDVASLDYWVYLSDG